MLKISIIKQLHRLGNQSCSIQLRTQHSYVLRIVIYTTLYVNQKQVDIPSTVYVMSKYQVLQYYTIQLIISVYSIIIHSSIQTYIPYKNLVEYVIRISHITKDDIHQVATHTHYCFNFKQLHSLVSAINVLSNIRLPVTQSHLSIAQTSSTFKCLDTYMYTYIIIQHPSL